MSLVSLRPIFRYIFLTQYVLQKLTNRLDKLENEIRLMLMLQKYGNQDVQQGTTTVTTKSNQIVQLAEMGAGANSTKGDGPRLQF